MHNDLGIRLTFKMIALFHQLFPQRHIVFDDTVMHHSKAAVVADMGMGVDIRRRSVGGPAGVSNTRAPRQKCAILCFFAEICNSAADL